MAAAGLAIGGGAGFLQCSVQTGAGPRSAADGRRTNAIMKTGWLPRIVAALGLHLGLGGPCGGRSSRNSGMRALHAPCRSPRPLGWRRHVRPPDVLAHGMALLVACATARPLPNRPPCTTVEVAYSKGPHDHCVWVSPAGGGCRHRDCRSDRYRLHGAHHHPATDSASSVRPAGLANSGYRLMVPNGALPATSTVTISSVSDTSPPGALGIDATTVDIEAGQHQPTQPRHS